MSQRILRIRNQVAEIPRVTQAAAELLESHGITRSFVRTVSLGLEEVVSNIIKYGYEDEDEHWIELTFCLTTSDLGIVVVDEGREFDPLKHPEPDPTKPLDDREPGGLGVAFYRRLFDEVRYERAKGKNILTVRKRLPDAAATP